MLDIISMPPHLFVRRCARRVAFVALLGLMTSPLPMDAAEQLHFASPEAALRALISAAKKKDHEGLLAIFGSDAGDLVFSGDDVADGEALTRFAAESAKRSVLTKDGDTTVIIRIGKDGASFPIPLVKAEGGWRAGVLRRRGCSTW